MGVRNGYILVQAREVLSKEFEELADYRSRPWGLMKDGDNPYRGSIVEIVTGDQGVLLQQKGQELVMFWVWVTPDNPTTEAIKEVCFTFGEQIRAKLERAGLAIGNWHREAEVSFQLARGVKGGGTKELKKLNPYNPWLRFSFLLSEDPPEDMSPEYQEVLRQEFRDLFWPVDELGPWRDQSNADIAAIVFRGYYEQLEREIKSEYQSR